ncbi:MAG: hypothetical protein JST30_04005 [Armatimonadetes bacterium]|nr:hypothetical protein [Armatimonadota bacterium]
MVRFLQRLVLAVLAVGFGSFSVEAAHHVGQHEHCLQCAAPVEPRKKDPAGALKRYESARGQSEPPRWDKGTDAVPQTADFGLPVPDASAVFTIADDGLAPFIDLERTLEIPDPPSVRPSDVVRLLGPPRGPPAS